MQKSFPIKTIALKQCRTCSTTWSAEKTVIDPHDQINVVTVKIAFCPCCADAIAEETDRPTYRRTGKKIQ